MSVWIQFAGQAGFIIGNGRSVSFGIDLYLSDCVEASEGNIGYKRLTPKVINAESVNVDFLIATHPHYDHFDVDAVPVIMNNGHTKLFVSQGCQKLVHDTGINRDRVKYVVPGDVISDDGLMLRFVECDHGAGAPDAVGVIADIGDKRIYMTGDTCLRIDRVASYIKFGKIDVLIAPINGAYGNMNEADCAVFSDSLKPKLTIPCHYGMFAAHGGNPGTFLRIMGDKYPERQVLLMTPGERIEI